MRWPCLLLLAFAACDSTVVQCTTCLPPGSDLSGFAVERVTVGGQEMEVWLAETFAQRQQGFMFASPDQLAPLGDGTPRGMLFLFTQPALLSFWMRDTFEPLDLAYVRADGTIAEIFSMVPLDETQVVASELVQFVLEARAGTFAQFGITVGDSVIRPSGP